MTQTNSHGGINIMVGHNGEPDHCAPCMAFHDAFIPRARNVDETPEQFWNSTNTLRLLYTGNGGTGEEFDAWLAQVPYHLRGEARLGEPSDSQVLTALRACNGRPGLRLDDFMPEQIEGMRAAIRAALQPAPRAVSYTRDEIPIGFVVNSGPMTSTGSKGATFIGHNSPRAEEVARYRSKPGAHSGCEGA